jgi:hypothetical protein
MALSTRVEKLLFLSHRRCCNGYQVRRVRIRLLDIQGEDSASFAYGRTHNVSLRQPPPHTIAQGVYADCCSRQKTSHTKYALVQREQCLAF